MSKNIILVLMYYHHKLLDLINLVDTYPKTHTEYSVLKTV
jgi:hypothetical protein